MFRKYVKNKLQNYSIDLNKPDASLRLYPKEAKKVAVIGGGIAGISAASNLAERRFEVHLFEKEKNLGGKLASWQFELNSETLSTGHSFHRIFRQYFNLRRFIKKIGAAKHLVPVADYTILFDKDKRQGFKALDRTPGYNVLGLRKQGMLDLKTVLSPAGIAFLNLLQFDFEHTYKNLDAESVTSFSDRTRLNPGMRMMLNSFSRMFFSDPSEMSMAELIKGLHFYLLSNREGLQYDALDDDFQTGFISYCEKFMQSCHVTTHCSTPVTSLEKAEHGFIVNGMPFDYCVICTDVKHTSKLMAQAKGFEAYPGTISQLTSLKHSQRYAVLRIWTSRFEADKTLPYCVFTDRLKCLDSVIFYHKIEKQSAEWSSKHKGGVFELHSYSLPKDLVSDEEIKAQLLKETFHYFPELEGMRIIHQHFKTGDDCPDFHVNRYKTRPGIQTDVPGLYLAGDWVKMNNCSVLMEAAYTSGALAANYILEAEDLRQNLLRSVPLKGILA